jgi:hypothetical protein
MIDFKIEHSMPCGHFENKCTNQIHMKELKSERIYEEKRHMNFSYNAHTFTPALP